jgi:murein DD-endopeptidase MepM/ murein hydrolase activator NlpD
VVGVVHVVKKGETVYRIARAYGVAPADLLEENGIVDPKQVAVGSELFVPGAIRVIEVGEAAGPAPGENGRPQAGGPPAPKEPAPPATAATAGKARLAWPLKGVLYGRYGVRSGRRHDGIDLSAPEGTLIGAAAPGTVIFAGAQAGYGSIVILRHEGGLVTLYAHCSALLVEEGAAVKGGQPIARVGQTGRSSGPHLHLEVREGTRPRNPLLFLP